MNQVVLMGRLTKDPAVSDHKTTSGNTICRFSLAVKKTGKSGDDDTMFVNCVAFGKPADLIAGSVHKGHRLLVSGTLDMYKWERDGKSEQAVEIIVNTFDFIERRSEGSGEPNPSFTPPSQTVARVAGQTTVPFNQRKAPEPKPAVQETVEEFYPMDDDDTLPF